jgi:hypothetical protein
MTCLTLYDGKLKLSQHEQFNCHPFRLEFRLTYYPPPESTGLEWCSCRQFQSINIESAKRMRQDRAAAQFEISSQ